MEQGLITLIPLTENNFKDLAKPGKRVVYEKGFAEITFDIVNGLLIDGWRVDRFVDRYREIYIMSKV